MTDIAAMLETVEIDTGPEPTHSVIWMHGLGANANDFVPIVAELRLAASPAVRFVFPNAPVQPVTINNGMVMRSWYDIRVVNLMRREDAAGIRRSQTAIETLVRRENARGVATRRIVLAGFSQGCAMALHTGLRLSEKLAGIIGLSGYLPLADSFAAERHAAGADTPIFLAHGTHDPVIGLPQAEASRALLIAQGHDVQWHTYPMPHSVHPDEVRDIALFLKQVLV
jgi:phospholipase/carboxylesterase